MIQRDGLVLTAASAGRVRNCRSRWQRQHRPNVGSEDWIAVSFRVTLTLCLLFGGCCGHNAGVRCSLTSAPHAASSDKSRLAELISGLGQGTYKERTQALLEAEQFDDDCLQALLQMLSDKDDPELKNAREVLSKCAELRENKLGGKVLPNCASSIQYKILREGNGKHPAGNDWLTIHYRGMLLDGTEFESSYAAGQPVRVKIDEMMVAWWLAMPNMTEGSKYKFWVPPEHAKHVGGKGAEFVTRQTIIYEIELLRIHGRESANENEVRE